MSTFMVVVRENKAFEVGLAGAYPMTAGGVA